MVLFRARSRSTIATLRSRLVSLGARDEPEELLFERGTEHPEVLPGGGVCLSLDPSGAGDQISSMHAYW